MDACLRSAADMGWRPGFATRGIALPALVRSITAFVAKKSSQALQTAGKETNHVYMPPSPKEY
jgi:hypothetical protein